MFRVALIGCGAIAKTHVTFLSKMPDVRIAALCDIKPDRAELLAADRGVEAPVYSDYIKMLDEVRPDAVHICTPHYLHVPMAVEALKRDIHVLTEKPVCMDEKQKAELDRACRESRARIAVSFQNRCLERNRRLKELIDSGEYGKIRSVFGNVLWKRTEDYYVSSGWRGKFATEGGSVMINQAIHTLDLLLWICGDPDTVSGMTANFHLRGVIETEDTAVARLTYPGGVTAIFLASTANSVSAPVGLEFRCEKGVLALRDGDLFINGEAQGLTDPVLESGKADWGIGHRLFFEEFYRSLSNGTPVPVSVDEAFRAVRVLRAVYSSNGEEIRLAGRE